MHCKAYLLACFAVGVRAAYNASTASTCNTLASVLPELVVFPEQDLYNSTITAYPFLQLRLHPTCIVRPKSAEDVAATLKVLRESDCTDFAIKGGGHNANAGFNNIDDGVTIDMQSMSKVELERGHEVVRVGAGSVWQGVYDEVEKQNRTVLGGRIGVVGVAGFTTGGGVSFTSPERGWSCDSVVNYQIVLASGEIVNVNATARSDLFAALKGGQSNFGIVTRFDLQTYPTGPIWGGRTVYAPSADTALLDAFTNFKNPDKYDPYAAGWVTIRYNHTAAQFTPVSIMWYTQPKSKPGALKDILDVKPQAMSALVEAYPSEHTRNASRQVTAAPKRTIWGTTSFRVSPSIVRNLYTIWKELVPQVGNQYPYADLSAELTFQSIPPSPKKGSHVNSLGFEPGSEPEKDVVFLQAVLTSGDARADEGLQVALKDIITRLEEQIEKEDRKHNFVYLNFAASFQDPFAGYGKEKVDTLRKVARKYDPKGLFQKQLSGGFKLFER